MKRVVGRKGERERGKGNNDGGWRGEKEGCGHDCVAKKRTSGCLRSFNEPTVGEEAIWRMKDSEVGGRGREGREGEKKRGACVRSVSLQVKVGRGHLLRPLAASLNMYY